MKIRHPMGLRHPVSFEYKIFTCVLLYLSTCILFNSLLLSTHYFRTRGTLLLSIQHVEVLLSLQHKEVLLSLQHVPSLLLCMHTLYFSCRDPDIERSTSLIVNSSLFSILGLLLFYFTCILFTFPLFHSVLCYSFHFIHT